MMIIGWPLTFLGKVNVRRYRFVWGKSGKIEKSFFLMYLRLMAETYNVWLKL